MKIVFRTGLAALALSASFAASMSTALAWGCIAVSDEGSYGYSYSFDSENGARKRALNECANRTTENSDCEITECDEDL